MMIGFWGILSITNIILITCRGKPKYSLATLDAIKKQESNQILSPPFHDVCSKQLKSIHPYLYETPDFQTYHTLLYSNIKQTIYLLIYSYDLLKHSWNSISASFFHVGNNLLSLKTRLHRYHIQIPETSPSTCRKWESIRIWRCCTSWCKILCHTY